MSARFFLPAVAALVFGLAACGEKRSSESVPDEVKPAAAEQDTAAAVETANDFLEGTFDEGETPETAITRMGRPLSGWVLAEDGNRIRVLEYPQGVLEFHGDAGFEELARAYHRGFPYRTFPDRDATLQALLNWPREWFPDPQAAVSALGEPEAYQVAAGAWEGAAPEDSVFTLRYPGFEFEFRGVSGQASLVSLALSEPSRTLPGGVQVGMTRFQLFWTLGLPSPGGGDDEDAVKEGVGRYVLSESAAAALRFGFSGGKVKSVRWSFDPHGF